MTIIESIQQVLNGVRPDIRGIGCAAIVTGDGRRYHVCRIDAPENVMVERFDEFGNLVERIHQAEFVGAVDHISWTCDELGGVYV